MANSEWLVGATTSSSSVHSLDLHWRNFRCHLGSDASWRSSPLIIRHNVGRLRLEHYITSLRLRSTTHRTVKRFFVKDPGWRNVVNESGL